MTTVFFLFLSHAALGLLAMLPFVPDIAGRSFFKFCSATSAVMATWAVGLLLRRFGATAIEGAPGGENYPLVIAAWGAFLAAIVVYNRAWHFSWRRVTGPALAVALGAGALGLVAGAVESGSLAVASDLASSLLLGAAAGAMLLGHWYLVSLDLPISALRRLTHLLILGLALRSLTVGLALFGPVSSGFDAAHAVAFGLWSLDGIFVWMRVLFGIAAPLSLLGFIWKTVELRSTQSATGILYVQLFLVISGELLGSYLGVVAGLPL